MTQILNYRYQFNYVYFIIATIYIASRCCVSFAILRYLVYIVLYIFVLYCIVLFHCSIFISTFQTMNMRIETLCPFQSFIRMRSFRIMILLILLFFCLKMLLRVYSLHFFPFRNSPFSLLNVQFPRQTNGSHIPLLFHILAQIHPPKSPQYVTPCTKTVNHCEATVALDQKQPVRRKMHLQRNSSFVIRFALCQI